MLHPMDCFASTLTSPMSKNKFHTQHLCTVSAEMSVLQIEGLKTSTFSPVLKKGSLIYWSSYKMRCYNLSEWLQGLNNVLLHLVWELHYISLTEDDGFPIYRSINNTAISWNETECVNEVWFVKGDNSSFKIKTGQNQLFRSS